MMKVGFKRFRRCGYDGAFAPRKEGADTAVAVRKTIVKPYFFARLFTIPAWHPRVREFPARTEPLTKA